MITWVGGCGGSPRASCGTALQAVRRLMSGSPASDPGVRGNGPHVVASPTGGWLMLVEIDCGTGVPPVSDAVMRQNTWGLDLAGQAGSMGLRPVMGGMGVSPVMLSGAGGIGGLLAVHDTRGTVPTGDDLDGVCTPLPPREGFGGGSHRSDSGSPTPLWSPLRGGTVPYDANGNVGQVVDLTATTWSSAAITAHYEYAPYGAVRNDITGQSYGPENPWRFSTKQWDPETALGYWGRRYHSATLGRWLNRDPIEEQGGFNLYAYVQNRPLRFVDSFGLASAFCAGGNCGGNPLLDPYQGGAVDGQTPDRQPTTFESMGGMTMGGRPSEYGPTPLPSHYECVDISFNCQFCLEVIDSPNGVQTRCGFFNCHGYVFGTRCWIQGTANGPTPYPDPPTGAGFPVHWFEIPCGDQPYDENADEVVDKCPEGYDYVIQMPIPRADGDVGGHSVVFDCTSPSECGFYQKCGQDPVTGPHNTVQEALDACQYEPSGEPRCMCLAIGV
jgi:RHS repeat-associated protein